MKLQQFRYFLVLAEELSFTHAARRLNMSQPPLSFQIAQLEAELGARLFDRTSRSVVLSEAGKALLPHARAVLARVEEARSHVQRVARGLQGSVQVGLAGSHLLGPFPRFIHQFRQRRPEVEIVLHEMIPSDHIQALRDGRIDLSISRNPRSDEVIETSLLWEDPLVVALPLDHPLRERQSVRMLDLKGEDFVFLRLESSPFAKRMFDACVLSGFVPNIVQQVVEVPAALNLVAAGLGVALVPRSTAFLRKEAIHICQLERQDAATIDGNVYILWRRLHTAPVVEQFRNELLEWIHV